MTTTYPERIIRPGLHVCWTGHREEQPDNEWTGITPFSWFVRDIRTITSTGMTLWPDPGKTFSPSYDWEYLHEWRIYIIRRGQSKKPGRAWEIVERHYLYKIAVNSSIAAYNQAARIARASGRIVGPHEFYWEELANAKG